MKSDYSEKEFKMIEAISPHWAGIIAKDLDSSILPPSVLNILALECFIEKKEGKVVDSLRRCVSACKKCNPYRKTVEYDNLIEF